MAENKFNPTPRKYYKSNYVDVVELITPDVYQTQDLELSGVEVNPLSKVINSHVIAAANISEVLSISAVANSQTSSLGNISGISQYFVKQNKLTNIQPITLEEKLLLPLGTTFANYTTSSEFNDYLSGTLLPLIIPATASEKGGPHHNIGTLSALTDSDAPSSVHNYLVDALGWFYFLNTSADGGLNYSPSSYVLSSFNSLYLGNTLETIDGVLGFTEYIWKNYETCSTFANLGLIPSDFVSGTSDAITEISAGTLPTYTSGTQKLENLKTLIDVVYSPLYIDQQDFTVKDAFQNYMDASVSLTDLVSKGPYRKFLNMLGFKFADLSNEAEELSLIYDIENAKEEHLQYIADLIGWNLRSSSPSKWRHQLRNAVNLYKKSGTLDSIQTAVNMLVTDSVLDASSKTSELWESYLPYMIWYALGTESSFFKSPEQWNAGLAVQSQVGAYSPSSLEGNIKLVTDYILLELYRKFPNNFIFHGERWPAPRLFNVNELGQAQDLYTLIGDSQMKPFHAHIIGKPGYETAKREAYRAGHAVAWDCALSLGPLGSGVYMKGLEHPNYALGEEPEFLLAAGDLEFMFSYRERENFPIPPFEEQKYYKDCNLTPELLEALAEELECFRVRKSFVTDFRNYVLSGGITTDTSLGSLNDFLMFFSGTQVAPNFDSVMENISDYQVNLLDLWNGKSSHLFIDFSSQDFDFSKDTLEADGKNALYEVSRISKEFAPAHTIARVNLNASAYDTWDGSSTNWTYLGIDRDGTRESYTSASILGNFEYSGVSMGTVSPGDNGGRGGLNTFKRTDVNTIDDTLLSSTTGIAAVSNVGRRALRRRNLQYLLPKEGYYDRTGFNGPVNWNLEEQNKNLLFYTNDPWESPGLGAGDEAGIYWVGVNTADQGFSSILVTNPFGGVSSVALSGADSAGSYTYLAAENVSLIEDGGGTTGGRGIYLREVYNTIFSTHVKLPESGLTPSSFFMMVHDIHAPDNQTNNATFEYLDGGNVPTLKSVNDVNSADIEDVGNDWYRCSLCVSGLGQGKANGNTVDGDEAQVRFYLGDYSDQESSNESLWLYAPQVEQWPIEVRTTPTAYQAVEENIPINQDRGELTLGYVASAGQFFPIVDPISPSGIWHSCENLTSPRTFSGVETSTTFPYRGLSALGSNYFGTSATDRYVDRGQVPSLYNTMHQMFEAKAVDYARQEIDFAGSSYLANNYWRDEVRSFANSAIASGLVINSYDDYINFGFGRGLQNTHRDYCKYFAKHELGLNEVAKTGGNIIAQVFGTGLFNCDFDIDGSAVGDMVATTVSTVSAINAENVWKQTANGTFVASSAGDSVIPLSGTFVSGNINNADYRNPALLSGIEFTDISGAPTQNQFTIFNLDPSFAVPGSDNTLIDNTVIKCKSVGALPRLRFDLSAYGDRSNYFIKDHKFSLKINALVAEENSHVLGGGQLGVWIHTQPDSGYLWSWAPNNKWKYSKESELSIPYVVNILSHRHEFLPRPGITQNDTTCLNNLLTRSEETTINNTTLLNIAKDAFETFEVTFDTRNYTESNNTEYLDIIPIPEDVYKITNRVNEDNTNYIVEIFFIPNSNYDKYLLLDNIELQDLTQRDNAATLTGHGIETSGIPHRKFVKEDRLYLTKTQLTDVLKFYNGLMGQGTGLYATDLASRDATITSGIMEVSGGSRLNYRVSPSWGTGNIGNTQANFNNFESLELDN